MRATFKTHIHTLLGIIAIGCIAYFLYRNPEAINLLNNAAVGMIFLICILHLIAQFIQAFLGWFLLKSGGTHISFLQNFWVNAFSMLCSYLPFQGSMLVRGTLLSTKYNVTVELYLTVIAFTFLLSQSLYSLVGSFAVLLSGSGTAMFLLLLSISILSLSPLFSFSKVILPTFLKSKLQDLTFVRLVNKSVMIPASLAILLGFLLLSYDVNLHTCFILACASGLSLLMRVTPAGLGIREGLTALFAYGINFDVTVSVLVVIVDRIISLLIIIPTGLMGWYNLKSSNKQVIIE
jgi:uncharacterized membrane protein YbhN (UPF0104 family)